MQDSKLTEVTLYLAQVAQVVHLHSTQLANSLPSKEFECWVCTLTVVIAVQTHFLLSLLLLYARLVQYLRLGSIKQPKL